MTNTTVSSGVTSSGITLSTGDNAFVYGAAVSFTVSNAGAEYVYSGGTASFTTVSIGGVEIISRGGIARFTTVSFGGAERLFSGGTTSFATIRNGGSGTAISTTVSSGGTEYVYSGNYASDTVVNVGGSIDVSYLAYTTGGSATVNTSDLLTVSVDGNTYTQQLSGDYTDVRFQLAPDTGSGTLVTAEAPCFRSGTRILTDRGEIAVEDLRVGDLVRAVLDATMLPIIWIGCRKVDCARHPKPAKVWPVRIAAGAFGPSQPHTELFLSPDHAVHVGEALIPIRHLINGSTITQVPMDRVTYYHIELPRHDVLLAEGLPAESYLDLKDGSNYANRPGPVRLYPDHTARMWEAFGCAPLIVTGPPLAAARALVARNVTAQAAA